MSEPKRYHVPEIFMYEEPHHMGNHWMVKASAYDRKAKALERAMEELKKYGDKKNWRYSSNHSVGAFDAWLDFKPDHFCIREDEIGGYGARCALADIEKILGGGE